MTTHPSNSDVQREAERAALDVLRAEGLALAPKRLTLAKGAHVNVDGVCESPTILVEVFAHQGPLKGGQRHKMISDALKLLAVSRKLFDSKARVILLLTDEAAAKSIRTGWRGAVLSTFGVEIRVVTIPAELAARVLAAQKRQRMTNALATSTGGT